MLETPPTIYRNLLHWSDLPAIGRFRPVPFSMPLSGTLPKTVNPRCQQLTVLRRCANEDGPLPRLRRRAAARYWMKSRPDGMGFGMAAVLLKKMVPRRSLPNERVPVTPRLNGSAAT